jgi:hypothetical protein
MGMSETKLTKLIATSAIQRKDIADKRTKRITHLHRQSKTNMLAKSQPYNGGQVKVFTQIAASSHQICEGNAQISEKDTA